MTSLNQIVVRDDKTVVEFVIDGAVWCNTQHFHQNRIVAFQLLFQSIELCRNIIKGIGRMLCHVVENDSYMVVAPIELLWQQLF